jgi:hypothetical protein
LFIVIIYLSLIYLWLNRTKLKSLFKLTTSWIILVVCSYLVFSWIQTNLPYLVSGVEYYVLNFNNHLHSGGSLTDRYNQIVWAYENNYIILTGNGIGKGYHRLLESFYALYYYRYGILGIISYLFIWGYTYFICLKGFKIAKRSKMYDIAGFFLGFNIFIASLPFLSLSSVITDQPMLMPIFYGTVGVTFGAYRYVQSKTHSGLMVQ